MQKFEKQIDQIEDNANEIQLEIAIKNKPLANGSNRVMLLG
jgi:hypothetical protein